MHEALAQLLSYLKGIWQHRWYIVVVAWVVSVGGWVAVYLTPDRYEASARVYVDTQTMLKPLLSGLAVQPNMDQQIAMMSRTLISRPNVEKVLRMTDLDIKVKTPEEKEALIDRLISKIEIKSTGRDNLYVIAYQDKNPDTAKRVVQSFLTMFVEGSLGDKRKDSDSARRFIDEQIKAYEQKLVIAENALKEFKRQNMGLMPGSGGDYFSKLTAASASVNQAKLELREAINARDAMKRQLADENMETEAGQAELAPAANPELDSRIQSLKKNLDNLRLNYTERHPDIIATKRIIEQLEEQKKQEAKLKKTDPAGRSRNPIFQQLKISLAEAEANVASMQARVAEYEGRFAQLKAAANAVPQVEADFTQLNRDYEVNKANYEKLLARRETAQISGEMEASSGGIDFRIVDPPRVPLTPSAPNRPQLTSFVLLAGVLAGLVAAFLVSQIRPTFNDRRKLREVTGLPILGTVSMIWTDAQTKKQKRRLFAFAAALLGLLAPYGAIMAALFLTMRTV